MTQLTGWQAVVDILKAEGVKYLSGIPTSAADLYDALYDVPEIQPILVRHEGAGLALAMGYALAANQPAVCFAGSGPGVANLAPVMLEALATCAPVIALASATSGQIEGMGAFQETDQIGMMKPLTKWAAHVPHAEKIPWVMRRAFSLASGGQPGPIFVELPKEVGRQAYDIPEYILFLLRNIHAVALMGLRIPMRATQISIRMTAHKSIGNAVLANAVNNEPQIFLDG